MKFKTKLAITFLTIILLPVLLSLCAFLGIGTVMMRSGGQTTYGEGMRAYSMMSESIDAFSQATDELFDTIQEQARENTHRLEDKAYLDKLNEEAEDKSSYIIIRKRDQIYYAGNAAAAQQIFSRLPAYGLESEETDSAYYFNDMRKLVKQIDFQYSDGSEGSAFIVTNVGSLIPEVKNLFVEIIVCIFLVLVFTACVLIIWIYRSVMGPVGKMREATKSIKEGNLDFELPVETDDELGQLCGDLEDMRKRLKNTAEEKLKFDKENKELISNISHDLKTPVTTIKGYAEGIMDGVADTPDKVAKYVRTIYNKASEMDVLINELTLYSKIDTNRIPYNFTILSVNDYFNDCSEDLSLDLEAKNVEFGYFNYVEPKVKVIADPEQIKRVVHNIVNNSVKYMDKDKPKINLRVKDVGDFVQIEIEDNGKGIASKDLPNVFERFYRTDASRNSSKGGSGIGLSIVKKIIEEHGGKIWATSREHTGTTMYFVLRKYQEVPVNE